MGYKILIDSCGEIPQSLMSTGVVEKYSAEYYGGR